MAAKDLIRCVLWRSSLRAVPSLHQAYSPIAAADVFTPSFQTTQSSSGHGDQAVSLSLSRALGAQIAWSALPNGSRRLLVRLMILDYCYK